MALAAPPPDPPHWTRWNQPPAYQQYDSLVTPSVMYDVPRTDSQQHHQHQPQHHQQHHHSQTQHHSQNQHHQHQPQHQGNRSPQYMMASGPYGSVPAPAPAQQSNMGMGVPAPNHFVPAATSPAMQMQPSPNQNQHQDHPQQSTEEPRRNTRRGNRSAMSPRTTRNGITKKPSRATSVSASSSGINTSAVAGGSPVATPDTSFRPQFTTQVDLLMRTIQQKADEAAAAAAEQDGESQAHSQPQSPRSQKPMQMQQPYLVENQMFSQPTSPLSMTNQQQKEDDVEPLQKPFACSMPGCSMKFWQKTHLEIHRRSHTGEKPYVCSYTGCGAHFSQLGNLRTHERRHTGEKPFSCEKCGKYFAQRGNLKAHYKTHLRLQPFECRLDGCKKRFTQLGNMKAHQNKYHVGSLQALTEKFAAAAAGDAEVEAAITEADRELFGYFAGLYKNSNKGIKGRGKHRRVRPLDVPPGGIAPGSASAAASRESTAKVETEDMSMGSMGVNGMDMDMNMSTGSAAPARRRRLRTTTRTTTGAPAVSASVSPAMTAASGPQYGNMYGHGSAMTSPQQQSQPQPALGKLNPVNTVGNVNNAPGMGSPNQYGLPHPGHLLQPPPGHHQQQPHHQSHHAPHHQSALPPPPSTYGMQHHQPQHHHQSQAPQHHHQQHVPMTMHGLPAPQHGHHGSNTQPGSGVY